MQTISFVFFCVSFSPTCASVCVFVPHFQRDGTARALADSIAQASATTDALALANTKADEANVRASVADATLVACQAKLSSAEAAQVDLTEKVSAYSKQLQDASLTVRLFVCTRSEDIS